ncbi:MAG: hypothetical protein ONB44_15525 [candidate division KSB1 bacterium]|nr:hypothetical protein [candidate division KSB1 bacterium]
MAKTPFNIAIKFTSARLTHYGGAYLLHQFFRRLELRKRMSHFIRLPERNTNYYTSELIITLIYPIILGLERIERTQFLKYNGLFRFLTGLPAHPDVGTLRRFLVRLGENGLPALINLHDRYRQQLWSKPKPLTKFFWVLC